MAIKDTDPNADFPYVFVVEQTITQSQLANHNDNPRYEISFAWRYYQVDESGAIQFAPGPAQTYFNEDFYGLALTAMQASNLSHVDAIAAQQESMRQIIAEITGKTLEAV